MCTLLLPFTRQIIITIHCREDLLCIQYRCLLRKERESRIKISLSLAIKQIQCFWELLLLGKSSLNVYISNSLKYQSLINWQTKPYKTSEPGINTFIRPFSIICWPRSNLAYFHFSNLVPALSSSYPLGYDTQKYISYKKFNWLKKRLICEYLGKSSSIVNYPNLMYHFFP